jgi:hypothetical protein
MKLLTIGLLLAVVVFAGTVRATTDQRYEAKASVAAHRKEAKNKQARNKEAKNNVRRQQRTRAQGRHHRGRPTA